MNPMHRTISLGVLAWCLALALPALAVAPSFSQILPRGGQRGTDVEVTITGKNLADTESLVFHEPGISLAELTAVEDGKVSAKLSIAPDCAMGPHALRVRTRTGISNLLIFSVGGLPEVSDTEPNSTEDAAQAIAVGTTVNGVVTSEDVDFYAVELEAGQRLAVEVEALRLGRVLFDPKLRLFDPTGHERVAEDDTQLFRQDAGFVYVAAEAGRHLVAISEAAYGGSGDYHYRLHIGQFPRPFAATPLGGQPGQTVDVTWLGDPGLSTQTITVPELPAGTHAIPVQSDSGLAPTNMPWRVSPYAGVLEVEPNNAADVATVGPVPGAFDGVIGEAADTDYFAFDGTKDQVYDIRVWARELGSPLDSVMVVRGPDGKGVGSDDDSAGVDSKVRVKLPADGRYTVEVYDHLKRGGADFAYRIEATPVEPKLAMKLIDNRPASVTIPQDNRSFVLVNASRSDFDGPIQTALPDLPEGLSVQTDLIPKGQGTYPVILEASPEVPVTGGLVPVIGTLQEEGKDLQGMLDQEVRLVGGNNDTTFYGMQVDRLALAVSEPAPFKVELVAPAAPITKGGWRNLKVNVTRAEGFADEISLSFPWLPSGMSGGTLKIPGDQSSGTIRLEVGGAAPGAHQVFVSASAGGYLLCSAWTPVEVQDQWVVFSLASTETEQGKPTEIKATIEQRSPYEGTFDVQLLNLPKGVTTSPQPVTKDTTELVFPLEVAADAPAGKFGNIAARTAIVVNEEEVWHTSGGAELKVYEPLPAELAAQAPPPPPPAAEDAPVEEAPERKTRFPTT